METLGRLMRKHRGDLGHQFFRIWTKAVEQENRVELERLDAQTEHAYVAKDSLEADPPKPMFASVECERLAVNAPGRASV